MAIHIPKGEGIKIIKQYSEATTNDSIYILPIDGKYAEMIIVDKVGGKRKVGFSLPENLALHDIVNSDGEITTQGNTYLKTQIDTLLNIERTSREGKDAELEMEIQSETRARESKDNELKTAIETEQQERIAKDAEINETISTINNELNSEKTTREQADISLDGKIDNLKSIVESLSDWKNLMVNEDADAIINTITEVVSAFRNLPEGSNVLELLNAKVNISSIVNNLESEIENVPLSAKQGKILKDLINDTKALLEQSNTTQDTAIAGKLDKTTATITEPNAEFKYAYLTNEGNETRRMLAGDLGKNVANSKPTSVAGAGLNMAAIWDIDTNGFPLRIKGLPDKSADTTFNKMRVQNADGQEAVSSGKAVMESLMASLPSVKNSQTGNYDLNFSEYMVYNPITGKFAKSDRPQIVSNFNVPQNLNISYPTTIANSNYTPSPTTPQDIRETFDMIKRLENGYDFTPVTPDMWVIRTMADEKIAPYSSWRVPTDINKTSLNGTLYLKGFAPPNNLVQNLDFTSSVANENSFFTVFLNKEFPSDRDWILRFRVHYNQLNNAPILNERGAFFGFSELKEITDKRNNLTDVTVNDYSYLYGVFKNREVFITEGYYVYCIKKGSKLSFFVYNPLNGFMKVNTIDYASSMKYFRMASEIYNPQRIELGVLRTTFFNEIAYWISE